MRMEKIMIRVRPGVLQLYRRVKPYLENNRILLEQVFLYGLKKLCEIGIVPRDFEIEIDNLLRTSTDFRRYRFKIVGDIT